MSEIMKKTIFIAAIAVTFSLTAFGQAKKMTVRDYFLAIPTEHIKADAKKRAAWIESEWAEEGYLSFDIPVKEITGEDGDGKVFGSVQVLNKKSGVIIGVATNMCEEGVCLGQLLFLDYKGGAWEDVTSDHAPMIDNDEVISILRKAPAFEEKSKLKDGVEVPIFYQFSGGDKVLSAVAGGRNGDGGVAVKAFKWNGTVFNEYEYPESPE